jgi:hypothetical protein
MVLMKGLLGVAEDEGEATEEGASPLDELTPEMAAELEAMAVAAFDAGEFTIDDAVEAAGVEGDEGPESEEGEAEGDELAAAGGGVDLANLDLDQIGDAAEAEAADAETAAAAAASSAEAAKDMEDGDPKAAAKAADEAEEAAQEAREAAEEARSAIDDGDYPAAQEALATAQEAAKRAREAAEEAKGASGAPAVVAAPPPANKPDQAVTAPVPTPKAVSSPLGVWAARAAR